MYDQDIVFLVSFEHLLQLRVDGDLTDAGLRYISDLPEPYGRV